MASIIDNRNKTMLESLKNTLKQAESVDILTAFFYFSGFNALAEELKDKKIRILVGCTIDPGAISELCNAVKNNPDEVLAKIPSDCDAVIFTPLYNLSKDNKKYLIGKLNEKKIYTYFS